MAVTYTIIIVLWQSESVIVSYVYNIILHFSLMSNIFSHDNLYFSIIKKIIYNSSLLTWEPSLDISDQPVGSRMTGTYQSLDPNTMGQSPYGSAYGRPQQRAMLFAWPSPSLCGGPELDKPCMHHPVHFYRVVTALLGCVATQSHFFFSVCYSHNRLSCGLCLVRFGFYCVIPY